MSRRRVRALLCGLAAALVVAVPAGAQQPADAVPASGDSPLMASLLAGDTAAARKWIAGRQDLERPNREGVTPLIRAAARGNAEIVRELLAAGVDPHRRDAWGATALSAAAHRGHRDIVGDLAERGADVNAVAWLQRAKDGVRADMTPLILAVQSKQAPTVELLLQRGANAEYMTTTGFTALSMAAIGGLNDVLRLLLKHGADPNAVDSNGQAPLNQAISVNGIETLRILLEGGADPDNRAGRLRAGRKLYAVPLVHAAGLKRHEAVALLLDARAHVDAVDRLAAVRASALGSMTPLTQAIRVRDAKMVEFLLRRGANPNFSDLNNDAGALPIHAAGRWGDAEIIDLLVQHGANPFGKDRIGGNALHFAALGRNHPAIEKLVQMGLSINQRTRTGGHTPVMLAALFADVATVNLLVKLGADPGVRSAKGDTAAAMAAASGRVETLKLLEGYNPE